MSGVGVWSSPSFGRAQEEVSMNVQVIFYSMYGHVWQMAEAVAAGAGEVQGAKVSLWQV